VASETVSNKAYTYQGELPTAVSYPGLPSSEALVLDTETKKGASVDTSSLTGSIILSQDGSTSSDSEHVSIAANVITIVNSGTDTLTFYVSGTLSNGQITIAKASTGSVKLILDGASITCAAGSPLNSMSSADLVVEVNNDSVNYLHDSRAAAEVSKPKGCLYSGGGLSLIGGGSGELCLEADGTHGINASGNLTSAGSCLKIKSYGNGIKAGGDLTIDDTAAQGFIDVYTTYEGHGMSADGNITIQGNPTYNCVTVDGDSSTLEVGGGAGIKCDGDLTISGGTYNIFTAGGTTLPNSQYDPADTVDDVNTKGLKAGDGDTEGTGGNILISGGTFNIDSRDDAIHASGYLNTSGTTPAYDDGNLTITGGTFFLATGDDAIHGDGVLTVDDSASSTYIDVTVCYEGMEACYVNYQGGTSYIVSTDDAINAASKDIGDTYYFYEINISGGFLFVDASGDGIDSNGNINVSGGFTVVAGPTNEGNGEMDYGDKSSSYTQTGGVMIAYGSGGQMDSFTASGTQMTAYLKGLGASSNKYVVISDASGNILFAFLAKKTAATAFISSSNFTSGTYNVSVASSVTGGKEVFAGVYMDYGDEAALEAVSSTSSSSFTFTSSSTHVSSGTSTGGQTGPGGNPGGGRQGADTQTGASTSA
jgi:hypothetical protein